MASRVLEAGTKLPSVDPLVRVILTWDFYRDIADDRHGKVAQERDIIRRSIQAAEATTQKATGTAATAGLGLQGPQEAPSLRIEPLPTRFESEEDYISRLYPLFLIETKQTIHRAKEMEMENPEIVVMVGAEPRDGLVVLTLQRAENCSTTIFTTDLVLLYLDPPDDQPPALESELTASARDPKPDNVNHILGIVESSIRNMMTVKVLLPSVQSDDERAVTRLTNIARAINTTGQRWYLVRVMGMSTVNREYQALMSFPEMLLKDDLLLSNTDPIAELKKSLDHIEEQKKRVAQLPPSQRKATMKKLQAMEKKRQKRLEALRQRAENQFKDVLEIPVPLMQKLEQLYNDSQLHALRDCLKASGVTLIQGPPGTGKTTTIVGVLSVILNASVKRTVETTKQRKSCATCCQGADDDVDVPAKRQRCDPLNDAIQRAQPWIYDPTYTPWYDEVSLLTEDLERFVYHEARDTDTIIDLAHVELDTQPRRVLVCAPSNAAIDEILKRLTADPLKGGGVLDAKGERYTPPIVRVGPNIHPELVQYSLETRANMRMQSLGSNLPTNAREMGILSESRVVCSTLSICGSREITAFPDVFDTVVIDEASQGVELSTLIPLRLGCRRLILVGDPKQLPATVFSRVAILQNYDQSLFQRLERAGVKVNLLSSQYRMHPSIAQFPSTTFYDGQLLDGPGVAELAKPPLPWYCIPLFRPIVFYSLDSEEATESTSRINMEEAMFICQLVDLLNSMFSHLPDYASTWTTKLAVISPYAEQVRLVRKLLKALLQVGSGKPCPIDVNTVDGFQGREKDFVIFSAVRAQVVGDVSPEEKRVNVGFLADTRRMNVALTRARSNLWVVGNARYLVGNAEWAKFCHYTAARDFQFNVNYATLPKEGYLKRWLHRYMERVPTARHFFLEHVPKFVEALDTDVAALLHHDKLANAASTTQTLLTLGETLLATDDLRPSGPPDVDDGDYDDVLTQERDAKMKPKEPPPPLPLPASA